MTHWTIDTIHDEKACVAVGDTFATPDGCTGVVKACYLFCDRDLLPVERAAGIPDGSAISDDHPNRAALVHFVATAYGYAPEKSRGRVCPECRHGDMAALTRLLRACMPRKELKFVVGKKYRTREGGSMTYEGTRTETGCEIDGMYKDSHPLIFRGCEGLFGRQSATLGGRVGPNPADDSKYDILSDIPIDEPLQLEAGKRYRRRDGKITGPLEDRGVNELTRVSPYVRFLDRIGGWSYSINGRYASNEECDIDLVELYEDPKEQPMTPKRSLPTVSLDDIFKKEPCWIAQMGPVAAAKKMAEMVPEGKVSLRTLNDLVMTGRINAAEADWVDGKTGLSRDYDGPKGNGYWGANLAKHLDNWENPKLRTIHELPVGTQFTYKRHMDKVPRRWVVLPREEGVPNRTQIMALEDGTVDAFSGALPMTVGVLADIVEPGGKPAAPKPVVQKMFENLKTGDCFKSGDEVFLRISGMSNGVVAVILTGDRKGIAVVRGSAVHDTLLNNPLAYLPDFIPSQTPT